MKSNQRRNKETMLGVYEYLNFIKQNYADWAKSRNEDPEIYESMVKDFNSSLATYRAPQVVRIISRGAVHSMVVMKEASKVKRGDIVAPINSTTPHMGFSHGNVLINKYNSNITWAGLQ
jgi:hypothetical protein